jgi:hypothetical protein
MGDILGGISRFGLNNFLWVDTVSNGHYSSGVYDQSIQYAERTTKIYPSLKAWDARLEEIHYHVKYLWRYEF